MDIETAFDSINHEPATDALANWGAHPAAAVARFIGVAIAPIAGAILAADARHAGRRTRAQHDELHRARLTDRLW